MYAMISKNTIRFAQEKDINQIVQLCKLHAVFEQCEYEIQGKEQQLYEHLFSKKPSLYCLVVELNDSIIGYATYMKQFSTWDAAFYLYMDTLFLIESARNKGLGEQLVNKIKEEACLHQCNHIQWQTPDFNTRAMKFYDRIGATSKSKERYFLNV